MSEFTFPKVGPRAEEGATQLAAGLQPPVADFSFVATGLSVAFTDLSTDPDGTIAAYHWNFDDGPTKPTARFSFITDGLTVRFTDLSTDVAPGTIASWLWNFGDGFTSTAQHPLHTFGAAGNYPVSLTVTDNDGNTSTAQLTSSVTISLGTGIPFGPWGGWSSSSREANTDVFTGSMPYIDPSFIVAIINNARAAGQKILLIMTGGNHDNYITDGKFELIDGHLESGGVKSKWALRMDEYNTTAIKAAVAGGQADGTVVGAMTLDETDHSTWGGVITPALVGEMSAYVKAIFPDLPAGPASQFTWLPTEPWPAPTDFCVCQYSAKRGSVTTYRDDCLSVAAVRGVICVFSLNILDGGLRTPGCPLTDTSPGAGDATGGTGTFGTNCRVTAAQAESWCKTLGEVSPFMLMWAWNAEFMARTDNQAAFAAVVPYLNGKASRSIRRP